MIHVIVFTVSASCVLLLLSSCLAVGVCCLFCVFGRMRSLITNEQCIRILCPSMQNRVWPSASTARQFVQLKVLIDTAAGADSILLY